MDNTPLPPIKLSLDALSCQRGERRLFEGLSLALKGGDMLEIKGKNGVGKTSLLRILSGLLPSKSGAITLHCGDETTSSLKDYAHYLGHKNTLKSAFSVEDNLTFWRTFSLMPGLSPLEALEQLGSAHLIHLPCGVLSAGQQRRVAFARLLVACRPLWLLDEPTAALDKDGEALVGKLISTHVKSGGVVMAATHLPLKLNIPKASRHMVELSQYQPSQAYAEESL